MRANLGAVRPFSTAAVLALFAASSFGQVVEKGRTFADLTSSHPCSSGLTERIARVTDCDAADDIGDGGGSFQCWARCDGTAPWETLAIGAGASGGVSGLTSADGGVAISDNIIIRGDGATGIQGSTVTLADSTGNLQWEGTTADTFEGNFTFADPTADWTWAWGADGTLTGGNLIVSHIYAATDNTYDLGENTSTRRFRNLYISGDIPNFGSLGGNSGNVWIRSGTDVRLGPIPITWGGTNAGSTDTTIERTAAGIVKLTNTLNLVPIASPPRTCDATAEGDIYSDTSHALCWCSGSAWTVVIGAGSCA